MNRPMTQSDLDLTEGRLRKEIIHSGSRAVLTPTNGLIAFLIGVIFYGGIQTKQISHNEAAIKQETADRKEADTVLRKDNIRAMDSMTFTFDNRITGLENTVDRRIGELIEVIKENRRIDNINRDTGR